MFWGSIWLGLDAAYSVAKLRVLASHSLKDAHVEYSQDILHQKPRICHL